MKNKYLRNEKMSIMLFICLMIVYGITYMTKNCYSAAMVLLVNDGVLTKSQTGTISAVFYLVYALFQFVGGVAADKYCPHKLISIGLIGAAVANAIISMTDNYYVMLIVWSLNAIVQFGLWPAVFKIASSSLAPAHRRGAVFYITFSSVIGTIFSYIVAAFSGDWRSNFRVSTIALIACIVLWVVSGRIFKRNMVENVPIEDAIVRDSHRSKEYSMSHIIVFSGLILLLPVTLLRSMFNIGVQTVTPTMIFESYHDVSPALASIMNLIPILIGVVGRFVIKFIYKKKTYNEALALAVMFALMLPFLAVMLQIGKLNVYLIILVISAINMISSMMSIVDTVYIASRFSKTGRVATVSGFINAMAALGIVMSNYVFLRIADNMGWNAVTVSWMCFAVAAFVISAAAIVPWKKFIEKTK